MNLSRAKEILKLLEFVIACNFLLLSFTFLNHECYFFFYFIVNFNEILIKFETISVQCKLIEILTINTIKFVNVKVDTDLSGCKNITFDATGCNVVYMLSFCALYVVSFLRLEEWNRIFIHLNYLICSLLRKLIC